MKRSTSITAALLLVAGLTLDAGFARADKLVHVAGGDGPDNSPAVQARLVQPFGVDFGPDGTIYIVEMAGGERLRAIDAKGNLVTVAGSLKTRGYGGDGGPALAATFNGMHSLAVGAGGRVYLADTWNNCVRVFDPRTGLVQLFRGQPTPLPDGKRQAPPNAELGGVYCVAFEPTGKTLYICDLDRKRIFRADVEAGVQSSGNVGPMTVVAGNGKGGQPQNGQPAAEQPLIDPRAVAVDRPGNVYILERGGNQLHVVGSDGNIRTVAGTGKAGTAGIGGPALQTEMNGPKHLCIDRDDSVLIADTENHRILRYVPGKEIIQIVAGTGRKGRAGIGGDPKEAEFAQPHGVIVHPTTGEIYISDAANDRVLKIIRQ
jgi:DNA-binding beta-propeller fold protein YncE